MARKSGGWWMAGIGGLAGGGMPALWPHLHLEDASSGDASSLDAALVGPRTSGGPGPFSLAGSAGDLGLATRPYPRRERCSSRPRP
jgi:hypothetical protein